MPLEEWSRRYPDETPAPAGITALNLFPDGTKVYCDGSGGSGNDTKPPEAARRCTHCGEVVKATDLSKQGGKWYHPGHQKAKGERWSLWCGPVMEDPSAGGGK